MGHKETLHKFEKKGKLGHGADGPLWGIVLWQYAKQTCVPQNQWQSALANAVSVFLTPTGPANKEHSLYFPQVRR